MSEHETNEQGSCPSCGSPSYTGSHTPGCPKNNTQTDKGDERLSLDEAQVEAKKVRRLAGSIKARELAATFMDTSHDDYMSPGEKFVAHRNMLSEVEGAISRGEDDPSGEHYRDADELIKNTRQNEQSEKNIQKARKGLETVEKNPQNLDWAKQRAMEYVEQGDLKSAIDSMVSDLSKDKDRPDMQKSMIAMMGMELRSNPNLTKEKVIEFIKGFN